MAPIDCTNPSFKHKALPLTQLLVLPTGGKGIATPLPSPSKTAPTNYLKERESGTIVELLTRFKNLIDLAAKPVEEGATKEVAAAQAFEMECESSALVRASEDLLQLTRELKELWLFGPLRGIKEGEGEGKMDEDSTKVGQMVEALLKHTSEAS